MAHGQPQTTPTIRGRSVYPGLVRGRARLVRTADDVARLEAGEVIVVPMMTPALVELLGERAQRAVGIVSDVGSVLPDGCPQVPSVLGTGIATRRILDGMAVTVDGDHGRVQLPDDAEAIPTGFRPRVPHKFGIGAGLILIALVARKVL